MRIKKLAPHPFYFCAECGKLSGLLLLQIGGAKGYDICLCVGCAERLADAIA